MAAGPGGRPAVEVYDRGTIVDVMIAQSFAPRILGGARAAVLARRTCAIAWGALTVASAETSVAFVRGKLRPQPALVEVIRVEDWFWIALADGRYRSVTVTQHGMLDQCRIRATRRPGPMRLDQVRCASTRSVEPEP